MLSIAEVVLVLAVAWWVLARLESDHQPGEAANVVPTDSTALDDTINLA